MTCKATEIIPLREITDVYNVSTGNDPHEFIVRRSRQGVTLYFSSPDRELIVKVSNSLSFGLILTQIFQTIRSGISALQDMLAPSTDRFRRFSNHPATLLHVGMFNIDSDNEEVSTAAWMLLEAVCKHLKYDRSAVAPSQGFCLCMFLRYCVDPSQ